MGPLYGEERYALRPLSNSAPAQQQRFHRTRVLPRRDARLCLCAGGMNARANAEICFRGCGREPSHDSRGNREGLSGLLRAAAPTHFWNLGNRKSVLADGFFDRAWGGHEGGRGNAPLLVADCGGAGTDGKATLLDFNEIDIVAGFEA